MVTPSPALRALAESLGPRATLMRPLAPMTTYGVGGPAALYIEVEGPEDLEVLRRAMRRPKAEERSDSGLGVGVFVIGRGSNLLVADAGFDGIVLHLGSGFAGLDLPRGSVDRSGGVNRSGAVDRSDEAHRGKDTDRGDTGRALVRAGAALALPVLARRVADAGWSGLSWAVGVPGSVGGAVRMNAGGHGSNMASCLVRYRWVDVLAEEGGADGPERLAYGYRTSSVTATQVVLEAELEVTPGSAEEERAAVASIVTWRRENQPGGSNAGSVFTNPQEDSAGRLIEAAGLKGHRLGTARVSTKHANFIQADKGGRAADVHALMEFVRSVVAERCGVQLDTEVRLLGFGEGKTGAVSQGQRISEEVPSSGPGWPRLRR
jgi:UDP-N-acetylmuramate dehydrogenase